MGKKCGKPVIFFEDLKHKYKEVIIIICIMNSKAAYEIAKQCEESDVSDYLFYKDVKGKFSDGDQLLSYIKELPNRVYLRQKANMNMDYRF